MPYSCCHSHVFGQHCVAEEVHYISPKWSRYKYISMYMLTQQQCILLHYLLITTDREVSVITKWNDPIQRELWRGASNYQAPSWLSTFLYMLINVCNELCSIRLIIIWIILLYTLPTLLLALFIDHRSILYYWLKWFKVLKSIFNLLHSLQTKNNCSPPLHSWTDRV
jgi:hypothetical protein